MSEPTFKIGQRVRYNARIDANDAYVGTGRIDDLPDDRHPRILGFYVVIPDSDEKQRLCFRENELEAVDA